MRMALSFWSSPRNDLNLVRAPTISRLCPSTRIVLPRGSACAKNLSNAVADHGDVAAVEVVGFGKETAFAERGINEPQVVRGYADEESVEHVLDLIPGGDGGQAEVSHFAKKLYGNRGGGGGLLLDRHGVFVAQGLAQPLFARHGVGSAELELVNPQRAGTELLGHVHQLLVQAGDDGSYRDHRGGADEHAEDSEERAEFVSAESVERQQQILANVLTVSLRHGELNSPILERRWVQAGRLSWRGRCRKRDPRRRIASRPRPPPREEPRR